MSVRLADRSFQYPVGIAENMLIKVEPPTDLELKPLPDNLEYVFLEEPYFLQVIISSKLSAQNKSKLVSVLKKHKEAFAWKTIDIPEVVKKEIVKLLDTGIIYPIVDCPWVSPIHCVPKKGGITVVTNKNDELVPARTVTGWRNLSKYSWMIPPSLETLSTNALDKMPHRCKDAHLVLN
ncbi:hypothetical protein Tco_0066651 [Tanacetum coccineum]